MPPVLVVVFNRPEVTAELFAVLRKVRPPRLWVAADGPRASVATDAERCRRTRAVVDAVDWPCEVRRLDHDHNLGLQAAMVAAVTWFVGEAGEGIVLEDDCVPHPDFFGLCAEVLDRYRHDDRVMAVTAVNLDDSVDCGDASYLFASLGQVRGWATWRRAWDGFDPVLGRWPEVRDRLVGGDPLSRVMAAKFDDAHAGTHRTWSRAWHHHVMASGGLAVVPATNLMHNIGFGPDATHTTSVDHPLADLPTTALSWPLRHPDAVEACAAYDAVLARYHRTGRLAGVRRWWRRLTPTGGA